MTPKSRKPSRHLLSGLCVFASIVTASAQLATSSSSKADATADTDTVKLNPFTVSETQRSPWNAQQTFSGSRVAENIMDIPINISIVSSDYLQTVGATNLTELLNFAGSGVNQRVSYRDDLSIRGFRESATRDGISLTTYANLGMFDVDRIEIIKGPTALIYGNFSSIGGTVNYVTKRPTSISQGDAHFSTGSNGFFSADVTQRGPITGDGRVRYRVTVGASHFDGYKDIEYENIRDVSVGVDWSATRQLEVRFDFSHLYNIHRDQNRSLVDPVTKTLANLPATFTTSADFSQNGSYVDRWRLETIYQPTKNLTARVLANQFGSVYWYRSPQPTPGLKAAEYPNYKTVGQRFLAFDLDETKNDVQADITWNADIRNAKNRLTAGWAYTFTDNSQTLFTAALPDIIIADPVSSRPGEPLQTTWTYLTPNTVARSSGWTAYVQDALTLFRDHLILTGGVREIPAGATTKGVETTIPRFGAIYKVNEGLSFYGAYAKSFSPLSGFDVIGKPFQDIYGKDKEVGVKVNAFGGRLFGSLTYFDILNDPVVTQVQIIHPVTGLLVTGNIQTAEQTNKGLEADLGTLLDVGPGQILGYATYYDANPKDVTGLKPARVVAQKSTVFAKYQFTKGPAKGFSFGGGFSQFGDQIGTGIPIEPGYTLYSAMLGYAYRKWTVIVNFDNLTDKKNAIIGSEANFSVYTARPFNTKLTLGYRW